MKIAVFPRIYSVLQAERHMVSSAIRLDFMLPETNVSILA